MLPPAAMPLWLRLLALPLLLALLAHAWYMGPSYRTGMLWTCHVATVILATGLLANWSRFVATGFLLHIAVGFPAWFIEMVYSGWFAATSILVHVLPPVAGALYVRRFGLPRHSALWAFGVYLAVLPVSFALADPQLNVNLARRTWPPGDESWPSLFVFHVYIATIVLALLACAEVVVRWLLQRYRLPGASH